MDAIQEMIEKRPRRKQLAREGPALLRRPRSLSDDWAVRLPFGETLRNAFSMMCEVPSIGLREGENGGWYTYLKGADEDALERVRQWQEIVGQYVVLRDCLALSFALDYDQEGGDPNKAQTRIGELRSRAKPYDTPPTSDTFEAADQLIEECLSFLRSMTCYGAAGAVVAMPPSRLGKPFDLPRHLARGIARGLERDDLSDQVITVKDRPPLKEAPLAMKLKAIQGTIRVDGAVKGRAVLLVDDLYQSGISMNYVAMEILKAGARAVLGLACEKTCRNDDNVRRSRA